MSGNSSVLRRRSSISQQQRQSFVNRGRRDSLVRSELLHLAPSVQRFWRVRVIVFGSQNSKIQPQLIFLQKARDDEGEYTTENLSPRSRRLMAVLPKPKSKEETVGLNLNRVNAQIAEGMDKIEKIQTLTSNFIQEHFERIPSDQVLAMHCHGCISAL
jgi:hypothetical protein